MLVMPFFIAIWKTFLVLSLTHHSVGADRNITPQDQTSGHLTGSSSSISTLDDGYSVAAFSPISDSINNNGESTSTPFPTTGMDISCSSDSNHKSSIKTRARRRGNNNQPTSCPSFLLPQDQQNLPPVNPQQPIINGGKEQGGNVDGPEKPGRIQRWRPKLGPTQSLCGSELSTLGLIPVCDSGYIGPTTVLTECRYCV